MTQPTPTERLASFLQRYPAKSYRKGEIILFQGEVPQGAYVVKSGIVKGYNLSTDGDEKPIGFYTTGSLFPGSWVFGRAPSTIYYYEAFTDTDVYFVPAEEYVAFIRKDPELLYAELELYVTDDVAKTMRLNALQQSRASDKLAYTLHYLATVYGKTVDANTKEIDLHLTHQDFANLTGLTRETTATELNKLKSSGVIDYGKRTPYRVNTAKLNDALNDQFMADLKLR